MPRFTTSDGLSLHYTDSGGDGPVVMCLAGLTRNGRDFDYVAPHLTHVRKITLDYRGRGQSDWAADFQSYNILRETQDVLELMDHLGLPRAAILGTSRGGLIGMTLAAMPDNRLTGLCLVDVGPEIDMAGLEVIVSFLGRNPSWKTYDEAAHQIGARMAGFGGVPASRWRSEVEKHFLETPDGLRINYDPKLRDAVLAAMQGELPDLWPIFDLCTNVPLAVIRGANSDLLTGDTLARMRDRAPNMRATTVPDRGHVPFLDEPTSVALLRDWTGDLQ